MRYSASEKFEIIELVEQSSLSIRRTLAPIGIPRSTFYDWYSRYQEGGIEALEDGKPRPRRIWNKIPDKIRMAIVNLALEEPQSALAYLQSIYKNPMLPDHVRMRAATIAIQYESPRLAVTGVLRDDAGFAAALERAIARSSVVGVIDHE
jgi:transposase-like protein